MTWSRTIFFCLSRGSCFQDWAKKTFNNNLDPQLFKMFKAFNEKNANWESQIARIKSIDRVCEEQYMMRLRPATCISATQWSCWVWPFSKRILSAHNVDMKGPQTSGMVSMIRQLWLLVAQKGTPQRQHVDLDRIPRGSRPWARWAASKRSNEWGQQHLRCLSKVF